MPKYAIFSQKQKDHCGSSLYSTPDGKSVEVTTIAENMAFFDTQVGWDDKVFVGEVVNFIKTVSEGNKDYNYMKKEPIRIREFPYKWKR